MKGTKKEKRNKRSIGMKNMNEDALIECRGGSMRVEKCFVRKCGLIDEERTPLIFIPVEIHTKIVAMSDAMGHMEWLGYLRGKAAGENYSITDVYVPEQEVSSGSVEVTGRIEFNDVVGTVHSHHGMGAFFSGTDDEFIGNNHDVMIVYGSGEYKARIRRLLKCGSYINLDAEIRIFSPEVNVDEFIKESKKRIGNHFKHPIYKFIDNILGNDNSGNHKDAVDIS